MHSGPQSGFIFCHLLEMFMTDLYCNLLSLRNKITCVHVMTAIGWVTSQSNELPHSWTPINRPENNSLPFSFTQIFSCLDSFIFIGRTLIKVCTIGGRSRPSHTEDICCRSRAWCCPPLSGCRWSTPGRTRTGLELISE